MTCSGLIRATFCPRSILQNIFIASIFFVFKFLIINSNISSHTFFLFKFCFIYYYSFLARGAVDIMFVIFIMIRPTITATYVFLLDVRIAIFQFYTAIIANYAVSGTVIVYYCHHVSISYLFLLRFFFASLLFLPTPE